MCCLDRCQAAPVIMQQTLHLNMSEKKGEKEGKRERCGKQQGVGGAEGGHG